MTTTELSDWDAGFMRLADQYKESFFGMDTERYLDIVANSTCILACWLMIYGIMCKHGWICKIEDLSQEEKNKLWLEAKSISKLGTMEHCVQISRVIHALGNYIQM